MKRFLYYFSCALAIGVLLYFGMQLQSVLHERSDATFDPTLLYVFIALFPVVIGLLIRAPKFVLQLRESKVQKFDWAVFLAFGIPALYIIVMTFLPFSVIGQGWLRIPGIVLVGGTTVPTIAGLVFGYLLLDSIRFTANDTGNKAL